MKINENEQKRGTLKIQKSQIAILVLNQSPISAVSPIVRFAGDQKTALTGESLYILITMCLFISLFLLGKYTREYYYRNEERKTKGESIYCIKKKSNVARESSKSENCSREQKMVTCFSPFARLDSSLPPTRS